MYKICIRSESFMYPNWFSPLFYISKLSNLFVSLFCKAHLSLSQEFSVLINLLINSSFIVSEKKFFFLSDCFVIGFIVSISFAQIVSIYNISQILESTFLIPISSVTLFEISVPKL